MLVMTPTRRVVLALAAGLVVSFGAVADPAAHAIILASVPAAGESTVSPPPYLVLRFNGRLEKRLSSVTLVGPPGIPISLPEREAQPDTLAYRLPPLGPGPYQAKWKVLSTDGHITEGVVPFTVTTSPTPR
jgi:methionine-rich copper-binding protein CopC